MTLPRLLALLAGLLAVVSGCDSRPSVKTFTIVSGSENRTLEPIVQDFCKAFACNSVYA